MTNNNICAICGSVSDNLRDARIDGELVHICDDCINTRHMVECQHCGVYHTQYTDCTVVDGGYWVCDTCLDELYTRCDECGDYILTEDANYIDGAILCDWCLDNRYTTCDVCGCLVRYTHTVDGVGKVCEACHQQMRSLFHDYGYKPEPVYYRAETDSPDSLLFGIESEIAHADDVYRLCGDLHREVGDRLYCKHDCSLSSGGVEMVTHPCTLAYHSDHMGWDRIYNTADDNGAYADESCGLHIHVGRQQMGHTPRERYEAAAKIVMVVHAIWDDLLTFSGREGYQIDDWCQRPDTSCFRHCAEHDGADVYEAAWDSVSDSRYHAVNLQNTATVEFRIFAGTDAESRVLSCLNVTNDIVTFAMTHTPDECLNTTWSEVTKERT